MADEAPIGDGYVEVSERIEKFYEKYPEGSLQSTWTIATLEGRHEWRSKDGSTNCRQCGVVQSPELIGASCAYHGFVVRAEAYRDRDDPRPGVGTAWEPFPGRTPYTAQSELMNAETSAWGRALAALGFEVRNGIASANEMRGREGSGDRPGPSDAQIDFFSTLVGEGGVPSDKLELVIEYAKANLSGGKGGSMSKTIDKLKEEKTEVANRLVTAADEWAAQRGSDGPTPTTPPTGG
jgi:hypothetical protein